MTDYDDLYAPFPGRVLRSVVEHDLPGESLRVAIALLLHCSPSNPKCNPGQRTISRLSGVHLRNVPRAIDRLIEAGIVSTMPGAGKRTTIYRFEVWIEEKKPQVKDVLDWTQESTKKPKQERAKEQATDPTIRSMLKSAGVKGPRLNQAAANERLTIQACRELIEESEDKGNPAAWLAAACANYAPNQQSDTSPTSPDWFTPRADSAEVHRFIVADSVGLTLEQYDVYEAAQRKYVEENPGVTPEQAGINADELVARIKAGDFDG